VYEYTDVTGKYTKYQYSAQSATWVIVDVILTPFTLVAEPENYPFLIAIAEPLPDQVVLGDDNLIYKYDAETGNWVGELMVEVGAPDPFAIPIADIKAHMKCFDPTKPAKFTIYVDQPVHNGNQHVSPTGVGHSFFNIEQNGISRTLGFYPKGTANPFYPDDPSQLKDNAGKGYDVSVSFNINAGELNDLLNYINTGTPAVYHLNNFNCTNWDVSACASMKINLPANTVAWQGGSGLCPGQFGQDMRSFTLPDRPVTTSSPGQVGNAPLNAGNCP
jgi:hypothetical protein